MTSYHMNIDDQGRGVLTVVDDGETFTVLSTDPSFPLYLDAVAAKKSLAEVRAAGTPDLGPLTELSERVFVNEHRVEFDGEEVHSALAKTIQRYWLEGRPYGGLIKFMERLSMNTCEHSRNFLWDWVKDRDLEINAQGLVIAYKGVRSDFGSVHAGPALVDDVPVNGHVPNRVGSVISMERSKVTHDPRQGCAYGLHVGTKAYAEDFGQILLTVLVDPVDVVSVPTDCNWEKMRVCRYEIIDVYDPNKEYEPEPDATEAPPIEEAGEHFLETVDTTEENKPYIQKMLDRIYKAARRG